MDNEPKLTEVKGAQLRYRDGEPIVEVMTCGHCGRSWNNAAVSSITPVPSGRCPFEYEHEYDDDDVDVALAVIVPDDLRNVLDDILGTEGETNLDDIRDARRCIVNLSADDVRRVLLDALTDHGKKIAAQYR